MINKKIISLILFALVFQSACEDEVTPPTIQTYGSLSGSVNDLETGEPIVNASVEAVINQVADTTDSSGAFFLDSLLTGIDSILVISEIHDTIVTVIDIIEGPNEFAFSPDKLPCFNGNRPAEDTTRVYLRPVSDSILELVPSLVFARFDTSIKDSLGALEIALKYDLKPTSEGIVNGLDAPGWSGFFSSMVGLRAEYYFTPYGKDNFCNFGADPLVDYAFGVFNSGYIRVSGTITIQFLNGTPEATALSLIESYGLRFLKRGFELPPDDFHYKTVLTKNSKMNVLDLGIELQNEKLINFIIMGIGSGTISESMINKSD